MHKILPILRKDLRHLWPHALVFWPLMYIAVYSPQTQGFGTGSMLLGVIPVAAILACWNLIVALIHQETLVGDRQYWLTRPIAWRDLLAAKALGVLLLVNLPLLLCQAAVFAQNGVSPVQFFSALLWKQAFFTACLVLPGVALACLTRNLPQAALVSLGVLAVGTLLAAVLTYNIFQPYFGLGWIGITFAGLVLMAGASVLVWIQYSRRRSGLARLLFAATLVVGLLGARLFPNSLALAIQNGFSPRKLNDSQLAISLDPGRKCPIILHGAAPGDVVLEIPVRVSDLPDDSVLLTRSVTFRVLHAGNAIEFGSAPFHDVHDVFGGRGWLRLYIPAAKYAALPKDPVEIAGLVDLEWFAHTATVTPRDLSEVWQGACRVTGIDQHHGLVCATPQPHASITLLERREWLQFRPTATGMEPYHNYSTYPDPLVPEFATLAPFPYNPGFEALQKFEREPGLTVSTSVAIVRKPAAYVERRFDFRNVRLADFAP